MNDVELRQRLQAAGVDVGPINESTRPLYVRLLASKEKRSPASVSHRQRWKRDGGTLADCLAEEREASGEEDFSSSNDYRDADVSCGTPTEPESSTVSTVVGEAFGWLGAGVISLCRHALGLKEARVGGYAQKEPVKVNGEGEYPHGMQNERLQGERRISGKMQEEQGLGAHKRSVRRSPLKALCDRSGTGSIDDDDLAGRHQVLAREQQLHESRSPPRALVRRPLRDDHSPKKKAVFDGKSTAAVPRRHDKQDWELRAEDIEVMRRPGTRERWKLGQGGFGQVFKALKDGVDPVAVKMYRVLPGKPVWRAVSEFRGEVELISHLRHRHVVQFYGAYVTEDGLLCLVTELMDLDLYQGLHRGGGRWRWYGEAGPGVLVNVACGLQYLHSLRPPVVHRDLKSPNVLLLQNGLAKIGDVGLAKLKVDSLMTPQQGYTAAWAAPEVIYRRPATEKVDIWSFGIVLWEVLTGKVPTLGKQLLVPVSCPPAVCQLFRDCLHQQAEQRPSAKDIVIRLRAMLSRNA